MTSLLFLLPLFIALLSGCSTKQINWEDPLEITRRIIVQRDEFKKVTTFDGPNCARNQPGDQVLLRAWKWDDKEALLYQLYIADEYTYEIMRSGIGWRFYALTHDSDGNALPTVQISKSVNWCGRYNCSYLEVIGATISRQYLEDRRDHGIRVKISGKGGEEIFTVPAAYVQAFLSTAH